MKKDILIIDLFILDLREKKERRKNQLIRHTLEPYILILSILLYNYIS